MTSQEMIERDLRMLVGDLQVQLIITRAQLVELKEQFESRQVASAEPNFMDDLMPKPNGSEQPQRQRPRMRPMVPGEVDDSIS